MKCENELYHYYNQQPVTAVIVTRSEFDEDIINELLRKLIIGYMDFKQKYKDTKNFNKQIA